MEKIEKLRQEIGLHREKIKELEQQIEEAEKESCQWLVGKCLRLSGTSYDKVLRIHHVNEYEVGFESINILYPYKDKGEWSITDNAYASLEIDGIERYYASQEVFNAKFEEVVEALRIKSKGKSK
jgi:hypothetical protein